MEEWEICHIPQASHIPMRAVMNALPQLQLSLGMPVAVLCHHGMRSKMVAQQLVAAGFEAVYKSWKGAFMPGRGKKMMR